MTIHPIHPDCPAVSRWKTKTGSPLTCSLRRGHPGGHRHWTGLVWLSYADVHYTD